MAFRIFLHEQNNGFREVLTYCLAEEGWEVAAFGNGIQALAHLTDSPDVWIVDADDEDGFTLIKDVKQQLDNNALIIATSERERVVNRVLGLELGCDDFVVKPFLPRELILRIQRILKKNDQIISGDHPASCMLQAYCIDPLQRLVSMNGENISLTFKEFELLRLFTRHRGIALSREQIIHSVWGDDYYGSDRAVDDLIRRIRKKVKYLKVETLYGYGYLVTS